MSMMQWMLAQDVIAVAGGALGAPGSQRPVFRKPPPAGVVEITGVPYGPIVERLDGSIMMANGNSYQISTDGGVTWGPEQPLDCPGLSRVDGLTRLPSGELVLSYTGAAEDEARRNLDGVTGRLVSVSADDGQTWSKGQPLDSFGRTRENSLIALSSGRLLYPSRQCFHNNEHPTMHYEDVLCYGSWRGKRVGLEGHYHYPELDIAAVSVSDDLGQSWSQSGHLYGWFDQDGIPNGKGGVTACDEPVAVECADGRVLFMARSTVGRLVSSYSEDAGLTWTAVRPMEVAGCYSPCRVARVPETGDLLLVWNQVNSSEILRGYRRGRLSAAISKDSGHSWQNFRTLEVSAGLEDVDRVPVDRDTRPVVALPWVGPLPDDYARFSYPYLEIAAGLVFIRYGRGWFEEVGGEAVGPNEMEHQTQHGSETVLRIYPLEYFCE